MKPPYRSVNDYQSVADIKRALETGSRTEQVTMTAEKDDTGREAGNRTPTTVEVVSRLMHQNPLSPDENEDVCDWTIPNAEQRSKLQTVENELQRLAVLKSYKLLGLSPDDPARKPFQKIAIYTRRQLQATHAFINVIDMGAVCVLGSTLEGFYELPRRAAICAHTILSNAELFSVSDVQDDSRFKDIAALKAANVHFYAGANLTSPEGYNIGVVCVVDNEPRPEGLTSEEQDALRDIRDLSMDAFVKHRNIQWQWKRLEYDSSRLIMASQDLQLPLAALDKVLAQLGGNATSQLIPCARNQQDLLTTAINCTRAMTKTSQAICAKTPRKPLQGGGGVSETTKLTCDIRNVCHRLCAVMSVVAKGRTIIKATVDDSVPQRIMADPTKVFHSLRTLLVAEHKRSSTGSIVMALELATTYSSPSPEQKYLLVSLRRHHNSRHAVAPKGGIQQQLLETEATHLVPLDQ